METNNSASSSRRYRLRSDSLKITEGKVGDHSHYLLEDTESGNRHRLYALEYRVAMLLDGERKADDISQMLFDEVGFRAAPIDVDRFATQLLALGFVEVVS